MSDTPEEEKARKTYKIQTLYAHQLFNNKKFFDAMAHFLKWGTDTCEVIRLFPNLVFHLSSTDEIDKPESDLPQLQGRDLENSILALISYLTEVRHKVINYDELKNKEKNPLLNDKLKNMTASAYKRLRTVIDTTLLKCYLQVMMNDYDKFKNRV